MVSSFESCTDTCGWVAALIAALAYGSFGVPIKATKDIDVHPLVLQSYKTLVMFLTCWGVIFLGVEIAFTKWGLLSGLLWVLGGTGGIYGIRMAGLAIAVGTWASIMIIVNFIFGILIFDEPVHDLFGTTCSFALLILGLVGMSRFSAPSPPRLPKVVNNSDGHTDDSDDNDDNDDNDTQTEFKLEESQLEQLISSDQVIRSTEYQAIELHSRKKIVEEEYNDDDNNNGDEIPLIVDDEDIIAMESEKGHDPYVVLMYGKLSLTKRQCGILGAVWNGLLTGGSLIPLHYAKEEGFAGAKYFISMSCGAMIANILLWCLFLLINTMLHLERIESVRDAFQAMPPWHVRKLWLPGFLAGLLLSVAMFGSILAVTYLGQGVGNSLVQTKILVSGLWGIFVYKEIHGVSRIMKWFLSASISVLAIVWLSLERLHAHG